MREVRTIKNDERATSMPTGTETAQTLRQVRIIIPAHNEAPRLYETVTRLWKHFGMRATLLVVANGCTDDTSTVVRLLARRYPTVELLEVPNKIGKGGAVRAGLTLGEEPFVAFVDADGSTAADQLDVLLEVCATGRIGGAIGSRWLPGSKIARRQPLQRRLASRTFNTITRIFFGLNFSDTQCGAKVFERAAIAGVLDELEIANFAFDVDVLLSLKKSGKAVVEIPISWENVAEYSKVRLARSGPPMLWALVRLFVRESVLRRLPFVERLGLSGTIPVRFGIDVLFLFPPRYVESDAVADLIRALRATGHTAQVKRVDGLRDLLSFGVWYVRNGQYACDAIAHGFGPLGSALLGFSRKRKFPFHELEVGASERQGFCAEFTQAVLEATKTALYFRRTGDAWNLSTQRLEASAIER